MWGMHVEPGKPWTHGRALKPTGGQRDEIIGVTAWLCLVRIMLSWDAAQRVLLPGTLVKMHTYHGWVDWFVSSM